MFALLVLTVIAVTFVAERAVLRRAPEVFWSFAFSLGKPHAFPLTEAAKQRLLTVGDEGSRGYRAPPLVHVDWSSVDGKELEGKLTNEGVVARFFPERGLLATMPTSTWGRNRSLWVMFHELRVVDGSLSIRQRFYVGDFAWVLILGALAVRFQPRLIVMWFGSAAVFTLIRGLITYFQLRALPESVRMRVAAFMSVTYERPDVR